MNGYSLDVFTKKIAQATGEKLERTTVYLWTKENLLQPALPPSGKVRGNSYTKHDFLVMQLRARLLKQGISQARVKDCLRSLRPLVEILFSTKNKNRTIIFRQDAQIFEGSISKLKILDDVVLAVDASREIQIANSEYDELPTINKLGPSVSSYEEFLKLKEKNLRDTNKKKARGARVVKSRIEKRMTKATGSKKSKSESRPSRASAHSRSRGQRSPRTTGESSDDDSGGGDPPDPAELGASC